MSVSLIDDMMTPDANNVNICRQLWVLRSEIITHPPSGPVLLDQCSSYLLAGLVRIMHPRRVVVRRTSKTRCGHSGPTAAVQQHWFNLLPNFFFFFFHFFFLPPEEAVR
jgi:hypothetical protein